MGVSIKISNHIKKHINRYGEEIDAFNNRLETFISANHERVEEEHGLPIEETKREAGEDKEENT